MRLAWTFHSVGEANLLERPDEIPTYVNLPPFQAKTSRVGETVMVAVPVLTARRKLQRAQPPQVPGELAVLARFPPYA